VGQRVEAAVGPEDIEEIGDATASKARARRDGPIRISRAEWSVYDLVDGRRTVGDIVERTFLSDFEGSKAFFDLLSRGLIEESRRTGVVDETGAISIEVPSVRRVRPAVPIAVGVSLLALLLAGFSFQRRNPANVFTVPPARVAVVEGFQKAVSLSRLRRVSEAIDAYYLTQGRFPDSPASIVSAGLLAPGDLRDPWGRPYRYILQIDAGKYYLAGFDAEGKTDTDLFFAHIAQGTGASGQSHANGKKEIIILE
jgi:hypothetical protein